MAHRLAEAGKKKKQLCRINRAPVLAADIVDIMGSTSRTEAPLLTVALGDLVTGAPVSALGSSRIRSLLAKTMCDSIRATNPNLNAVHLKAIMFSEMTMSILDQEGDAVANMEAARRKLLMIIQNNPPTMNEVLVVWQKLWRFLLTIPVAHAVRCGSIIGLPQALDMQENTNVNNVRLQLWTHGGHFFSADWLENAELRAIWTRALNLEFPTQETQIPGFAVDAQLLNDMTFRYDQFLEEWRRCNLVSLCAYYEAATIHYRSEIERDSAHALFVCLADLTKGQNKTEGWIQSRFRRVQEGITGMPDLDVAVVSEFSKIHSNATTTDEQIFAALAAAYKCLEGTPASSLCWVVEQAAASNITSALNVADVISKLQLFPLAEVATNVVPEIQLTALVRLAMHVIFSRFCTLVAPPVTVKEYADLAYLCMAITRKNSKGNDRSSLVDYAGDFVPYLSRNRNDLDAVASQISEASAGLIAKTVAIEALVRKFLPEACGVYEMEGEFAIYYEVAGDQEDALGEAGAGPANAPQPGPSSSGQQQGSGAPPARRRGAAAVALPRNYLPDVLRRGNKNYRREGLESLVQRLRNAEDPRYGHFRKIMAALGATALQSSAYFQDMLSTQYRMPYNTVAQDIKDAMVVWLGDEATTYFAAHAVRNINTTAADSAESQILETLPLFPLRRLVVPPPPVEAEANQNEQAANQDDQA